MISAFYCGKWTSSVSRGNTNYYAINIRLFITACLALLPIIKAYIILSNTTTLPLHNDFFIINNNADNDINNVENITSNTDFTSQYTTPAGETSFVENAENVVKNIQKGLNRTSIFIKGIFDQNNSITQVSETLPAFGKAVHKVFQIDSKATAAKPIDYLVAGTEGLAWVVHFCFLFGLRRGSGSNPRGPVSIRALIFLLTGVSILLLRSHVKHTSWDDVLPNLSLGFSISVVTLLVLYALTLIPGSGSLAAGYNQASVCLSGIIP